MSSAPEELQLLDFNAEKERLLGLAQAAPAERAASTLYRGDGLRQTMVALLANAEMTEHESPPEAFIHVLSGEVTIHGAGRNWVVSAGELLPVPPERHSVTANNDSVFTLTVLRAAAAHQS